MKSARDMFLASMEKLLTRVRNFMDIRKGELPSMGASTEWQPGQPTYTVDEDNKTAELRLYGDVIPHLYAAYFYPGEAISDVGTLQVLDKLKGYKLRARINSNGGDVFAGLAIANYVRERKIHVTVDSMAASIASVIAASSPNVHMLPGSIMMVHNPWSCVCGNAVAMRAEATVLDQVGESLLDVYSGKSGKKYTRDEWRAALAGTAGVDGTWMTGDQSVAAGIADSYDNPEEMSDGRKAMLVERRKAAAASLGVELPKNLETVATASVRSSPKPSALGPVKAEPGARDGRRPGVSYL